MDRIAELFAVELPVWELVLRGTTIYIGLFLLFRFAMRRDVSGVGLADMLLLVLVADAAQNAMAGEYRTITEGLIVVATLVGWNALFDYLAFRFPRFKAFAIPDTILLVRDGRVQHRNLRREYMTLDDLMSQMRDHGVERLEQVKRAYLESDGEVSVIRRDEAEADRLRRRKPGRDT